MLSKILKQDLSKNKITNFILFLFILLAAMLISNAVSILETLSGSMNTLLAKADTAHFVQMHAGDLNEEELDLFAQEHPDLVASWQTVRLLNINGANLYLGSQELSEVDSIMENAFVTQNHSFDYLLDTNNEVIELKSGQTAVPIYHMQKYDLRIGDKVTVRSSSFEMEFTIAAFARDSLMNPSLITSKRFLISEEDWNTMAANIGEIEYMVEVQTTDTARVNELQTLYENAGLPQRGTALDYSLVRQIHLLSDGITAAVIILIALLLIFIAALCLRFIIGTAIEEDYREIGMMKGIGISAKHIRRLYMTKYIAVSGIACLLGYLISLITSDIFTSGIALYMGRSPQTLISWSLPAAGAALVFAAAASLCRIILNRFRKISAVEAIRTGTSGQIGKQRTGLTAEKSPVADINIFLGVREIILHLRQYLVLGLVFVFAAFLMILPLNLLTTLQSSSFISYMGTGECDIRIDLQQDASLAESYRQISAQLEQDEEVYRYAGFFTKTFKALNDEGEYENIRIEFGDFSLFPLTYSDGTAPARADEIALSSLLAEDLNRRCGDTLDVVIDGVETRLTICGIYQDVTNGGKTSKAVFTSDYEDALYITVSLDLVETADSQEKTAEYTSLFVNAKVTGMTDYIRQTLGNITLQLQTAAKAAFALAISVSILITALFFRMLIAKDKKQTAIMMCIGFTAKDIRRQYAARAFTTLAAGLILGTLLADTVGESFAALIITGLSDLSFTVNPILSYVLCPAALILAVGVTIYISSQKIKYTDSLLAAAE